MCCYVCHSQKWKLRVLVIKELMGLALRLLNVEEC